jgi:2-iminobutanoate/2-iminopropanoate deaminase
MDKAVVYSARVGKVIPPGVDRAAALAMWPRWSLGIRVANFLFASGMGGSDAHGRAIAPDDPRAQVKIALGRLVTLMEAGGASVHDLIMVRVFLDDPANADEVLTGVGEFFAEQLTGGYPSFSMVVASTSDPSVVAEIEAWAATSHESTRSDRLAAQFRATGGWSDYAHAARVGSLWFLSGQLPIDAGGVVVGETATTQTHQVLHNVEAVLGDNGLTASDLVRLTVWVAATELAAHVREVLAQFLRAHFAEGDGPAISVLVAPLVEPGALVQIEAVATTGHRRVVGTSALSRPEALGVAAVGVVLSDQVDSFVRRFTWPELAVSSDASERPASRRPLGEIVFLSAQAGTDATGALVGAGMGQQTTQALENMRTIVESAGGTFSDIVQFDIYYRDRSLYGEYNAARIDYLEKHNPDSAWFAGSGPKALSARPGAVIEIESIAVIQS